MYAQSDPHIRTARRSALIPHGVVLSPEEEGLIAHRIGYRPVPPPGASPLAWFAPCLRNRSSMSSLSSIEEENESNDGRSDDQDIQNMNESDPMGHIHFTFPPENAVPMQEDAQATLRRESQELPFSPRTAADDSDEDSESSESCESSGEQEVRDQKPDWRVEIPQRTETLPFRPAASRTSSGSPFSTQLSPSLNLPMSNISPGGSPAEDLSPREGTGIFV